VTGAALPSGLRTGALRILTPEGVAFRLRLAGPISRFLAWLVDLACISILTMLVDALLSLVHLLSADLATALTILVYFAVSVGYGIGTEWAWRGQTLGKRVLGLRVMDIQGFKLTPGQIVVRNLFRAVDLLPAFYLLGGAAALSSRHGQRLGDLAANTVVVRTSAPARPDLARVLPDRFNSLRSHPHLVARLRNRVSPAEADAALSSLLRRDRLDPDRRVSLFREVADHFRRIVPFPPDTCLGISDEQYVRNVVDILFNRKPAGKKSAGG
jgi:uncharacterized RDD family membrane protein YckC